jgi:hypothetical protein
VEARLSVIVLDRSEGRLEARDLRKRLPKERVAIRKAVRSKKAAARSAIFHRKGDEAGAQALNELLGRGLAVKALKGDGPNHLVLLVGKDWPPPARPPAAQKTGGRRFFLTAQTAGSLVPYGSFYVKPKGAGAVKSDESLDAGGGVAVDFGTRRLRLGGAFRYSPLSEKKESLGSELILTGLVRYFPFRWRVRPALQLEGGLTYFDPSGSASETLTGAVLMAGVGVYGDLWAPGGKVRPGRRFALSAFADLSYRVSVLFPEGVSLFLVQQAPVRIGVGVNF